MKPALKSIVFFCILILLFNQAFSQSSTSKYEFGVNGGVLVYQGDLTPERLGSYKTIKPIIGISIGKVLSSAFSARLTLSRGKLSGNEAKYQKPDWRQQRAFAFSSPLTELTAQIVWSVLENSTPRFSPYLFTGAGLAFVKIKRDYSKIDPLIFAENQQVQAGLAVDAAHSLPRMTPVVPIGAGVRYYMNDQLSLTAETNYRFGFTDYLDGFSYAANPKRNDHYLSHSIGLVFAPGSKDKRMGCPVMKY